MGTKSIKIDEDSHRRAQALADRIPSSIKDFIEAAIGYFYRTGLDPRDLSDSGHSKMLNTLNQRMDFLVGFNKKQETDHILPLKQMIEELSDQIASLPKQNGHSQHHEPNVETEINELIKELYPDGICCPNCKNPQNFTFRDPNLLICQHPGCNYQLQIIWGEIMFSELDVLNLLTGGITRKFEGAEIQGERQSVRFCLNDQAPYELSFLFDR